MLDDLLSQAAGSPLTVTLTRGNRESLNLEQRTLTLAEFYDRLRQHPVVSDKNTAEAIIPGVVAPCPEDCRNTGRKASVDCGGGRPHRLMENIRELSALFVDLDGWSQSDVDTYIMQARGLGLEFLAYSSYSYAPPEYANCRLVFPLSVPVPVGDPKHWRKTLWPVLIRAVGLTPENIDSQCSDASRLYYLPCKRSDSVPVWTAENRGHRLDAQAIVDGLQLPVERLAGASPISIVKSAPVEIADIKRDTFWLALRAEAYNLSDLGLIARAVGGLDISINGERHAGILALTRLMALAYPGNDWDTLVSFVTPCLEALGDERDFVAEAERAFEGARHNLISKRPVSPEAVSFEDLREERRGIDTGLARRFARVNAANVRKLSGTRDTWLLKAGHRWELDANGNVIDYALSLGKTFKVDQAEVQAELEVMKAQVPQIQELAASGLNEVRPVIERFQAKLEALETMATKTIPRTIDTASSKAAMDRFTALAGVAREIKVDASQLDSVDWLLNTQSGPVDLRTGQLCTVPAGAYLTKTTPGAYDSEAKAPAFEAALVAAIPDPDIRAFFQRAVGYAITGSIKEQKMFFLVGEGGNGKSTLLVAILKALGAEPGGYAGTTPKAAVVDSHAFSSKEHQTADLRGLRMVQVMELNARERLAADRIKQVTGGDFTTAARKYENSITFMARCKLFMPCNVMPQVSDQDHGTWRRLVVIPFTQRLDGTGVTAWNGSIQEALEAERDGILAWAVRGAVEWYARGLVIPTALHMAMANYRESEDPYSQFFKDRVELKDVGLEDARVSSRHMYQAYLNWAADEGIRAPVSAKVFNQQVRRILVAVRPRVETDRHTRNGQVWLYVALI